MFRRPLGFNGRIGRAEFWLSNMVIVLSGLAFGAFMITSNARNTFPSDLASIVLIIYLFILAWFGLAQIVKRSHDLGKTFTSRFSLAFEAGDSSDNEYGPSPYQDMEVNWLVLFPAFIGMIIGAVKGSQLDFPIMLGMLGFSVGILAGSLFDLVFAMGSSIYESGNSYRTRSDAMSREEVVQHRYPNGRRQSEGKFVNEKKEGLWTTWYENGQKSSEGKYVNGKGKGYWTTWYDNGQKRAEGNLRNGRPQGLWISWHENGQKKLVKNYENGKAVNQKYWDVNGREITRVDR